ncbi:GspE/PulE family protein [Methylomarinum sp. Ch1-1]|uniref:GspE/PulE family protein n=1 Tax=Methylomarinum roseum TaxID=3067653 RepID=A0AAU7NZ92_9GAMM|nr:GspE/PulE family protein [Methylomarinum sp. Ch1-1]MDP4521601.1 GspE/PulE family protein [Methylomarinum sp. Ch1-1]
MKKAISQHEHRLTVDEVLDWMLGDQLIDPQEYAELHSFSLHWENRDRQAVEVICQYQAAEKGRLRKHFTEEKLSQWIAAKVGLPYYFIDPLKIDVVKVTTVCPKPYAERYGILPVAMDEHSVTVATSEPFLREWEADLGHMLKKKMKRVYANAQDIARYSEELYAFSKSVKGASNRPDQRSSQLTNLEQLVELGEKSDLEVNNRHIVSLVNWLFQYAFDQRASDIHLEPRRGKSNVRFRIDGVMHHVYELPSAVMDAVVSRIKTLGRMNIAEKRRPQDGRLKTLKNDNEVELRLSTMPTAFGEKMVMRIFDPEILLKNFSELGFNKKEQQLWREMSHQAHGIILVTGPTGSGKTTTLYSTLKQLATAEVNVCTVEDPIELIEPGFNQMQVQHNIGLNFAAGIRTLMRQDPDIIMVGEIRDLETAEMAVQASLTGHLVLSTLHTNDAPSAVTRMLELGVKPYLIKLTLLGVMAQRLIRTLCPKCKRKTAVDEAEWRTLVQPFKVEKPETIYRPGGCNDCRHTGYAGRVGIYEVFQNSPTIQRRIVENCDATGLQRLALQQGMRTLRLSGVEKVLTGLTSIEEVLRVAPESSIS